MTRILTRRTIVLTVNAETLVLSVTALAMILDVTTTMIERSAVSFFVENVFFTFSKASAAIILRATTTRVLKILTGAGSKQADMLSILTTSLQLRGVVRSREILLLSNTSVGVRNREEKLSKASQSHPNRGGQANLGTVVGRLQHDRRVAELLDQAVATLNGWKIC